MKSKPKQGGKEREFQLKVEKSRELFAQLRAKQAGREPNDRKKQKSMHKDSIVKLNQEKDASANAVIRYDDSKKADRYMNSSTDQINMEASLVESQSMTYKSTSAVVKRQNRNLLQQNVTESELMNTSLSQMLLDRQLKPESSETRLRPMQNINVTAAATAKAAASGKSLTKNIFHGEKIQLNSGQTAFKPISIETVIEPKIMNQQRTTEENIDAQHRLDFASVEGLISKQQLKKMELNMPEDYPAYTLSVSAKAIRNRSTDETPLKLKNDGRNAQLAQPHVLDKLKPVETYHKHSAEPAYPIPKRASLDESRQLHHGLTRIQQAIREQQPRGSNFASSLVSSQNKDKRGEKASEELLSQNKNSAANVKFDESGLKMVPPDQHSQLQIRNNIQDKNLQITGASSIEAIIRPPSPPPIWWRGSSKGWQTAESQKGDGSKSAQLVTAKLFRQSTGLQKDMPRRTEDKQVDYTDNPLLDECTLAVDVVITNPLQRPYQLRSNKTFHTVNRKSSTSDVGFSGTLDVRQNEKPKDSVSLVAKQYRMHVKNKKRMHDLMTMLANRKITQKEDLNNNSSNLGDSNSNIDSKSSQVPTSRRSKLPSLQNKAGENLQDSASSQLDPINLKNMTSEKAQKFNNSNKGHEPTLCTQSNTVTEPKLGRFSFKNPNQLDDISRQHRQTPARSTTQNFKTANSSAINELRGTSLDQLGSSVQAGVDESHISDRFGQRLKNAALQSRINPNLGSRYKKVRSSLFKKTPMLSQKDSYAMSHQVDDGLSDHSLGQRSQQASIPKQQSVRSVQNMPLPSDVAELPSEDESKENKLTAPNMAHKRFYMSSYPKVRQKALSKQSPARTQSLQFNQGLSFVMVKGKAQPSEKYIYQQMLPYTTAQNFSSVQVKSSMNRHTLIMQQNSSLPLKSRGSGGGIGQKTYQILRKGKNKHVSRQSMKKQGGSQTQSQTGKSNRKGVIVEMKEEYSHSGGSDVDVNVSLQEARQKESIDKQEQTDGRSWSQILTENEALKDQLMTQIVIFEQYLKVAVLQHKTSLKEEREEAIRLGLPPPDNKPEEELFMTIDEFEIEREKQQPKKIACAISHKKKQKKTKSGPKDGLQGSSNTRMARQNGSCDPFKSPKRRSQKISNEGSATRNIARSMIRSLSTEHRSEQRLNEKLSEKQSKDVKVSFKILSKQVNRKNMRALEHLKPITGNQMAGNSRVETHAAHRKWIAKIQKTWGKLNRHRNAEAVRIEDEIKRNRAHISDLMNQNLFELDINAHDQRLLLCVVSNQNRRDKRIKNSVEQQQIQQLQERIRVEMERHYQYQTWGINNLSMELRLKIRATEDIIECAQRLEVKADEPTERELDLLKQLRDRTYADIRNFVNEREKKHWRLWDRYGGRMYKPFLDSSGLTLGQIRYQCDLHLIMVSRIEEAFDELLHSIPTYNTINIEMIKFATKAIGNERWLKLFQLRQLRHEQNKEQHTKQFVPPVDQIRKHQVDPFTFKALPGEGAAANRYEGNETKVKSWWARIPSLNSKNKKETLEARKEEDTGVQTNQDTQPVQNLSKVDSNSLEVMQAEPQPQAKEVTELQNSAPELQIEEQETLFSEPQSYTNNDRPQVSPRDPAQDAVKEIATKPVEKPSLEERKDDSTAELEQMKTKTRSWLQILEKERQDKEDREKAERANRAARLARLFEEADISSLDDEDFLDAGAAEESNVAFLDKISAHLSVEKKLLEAWQEKDDKLK